jgi:Leucine-rich repeat (LRR) protein
LRFSPDSEDRLKMKKIYTVTGWLLCCVLFCFLLQQASGFAYGAIPAEERTALIALYNSTGGENWRISAGWKGNNNAPDGFSAVGTEGSWYGVTVTGEHVTAIELKLNNLVNSLPPEIGNLSFLKSLVLTENFYLVGSIPAEIGNLGNLEVLDITSADIDGLPAEIGNLSSLKVMNLANNKIPSVPPELGNLSNLEQLDLSNNYKISVPPELGNLDNLEVLDLEWSYIGVIPPQWQNLSSLKTLNLKYNEISQCPPELGNLPKLENLDLSYNILSTVPGEIGNLSTLKHLDLYDNHLESLPNEIANLSSLETLDLTFNYLNEFPAVIVNLVNLKSLSMSTCNMKGTLPTEIGKLTRLERLDLSFNNFSGGLEHLAPLKNLKELVFYYNFLETIPAEIGNLINLEYLDLHHNNIAGAVPVELGHLVNLKKLELGENKLTQIPGEIGNLNQLEILNLSRNSLTGIPDRLSELLNLIELRLNMNQITGVFPENLFNLTNLKMLLLSNNQLNGTIPSSIMNLVNLKYLGLANNQLSGEIPTGITQLTMLESLDLNRNQLEGGIPPGIFELPHLYDLYLASNKLSGKVPSSITNKDVFWSSWGSCDMSYNALYNDDPEVNEFLNIAMYTDNWMKTQTLSPTSLWAKAVPPTAIRVSWSPILFNWCSGGYEVYYSTARGGPWNYAGITADKTVSFFIIDGLSADTVYYFRVRTKTQSHKSNKSDVYSEYSDVVSTSTANIVPGGEMAPFGNMELPLEGTDVYSGSIAVSGWALDDAEVTGVKIFNLSEGTRTFIGDAVFVEGARPDVAATFPGIPNNNRAGWGYMMLTNFLPNKGNGTYRIMAMAYDSDGNETALGTKTIVCDNLNAQLPFGAIDTPKQGGLVFGNTYVNYGWVLTPQPNTIPVDGSTIYVWVDGVKQTGNPVYNNYRQDIASYFPEYNNSNGAVGYYYLDIAALTGGLHTIQWTAMDDDGNQNGIGSRFFTVQDLQNHSSVQRQASLPERDNHTFNSPDTMIPARFSHADIPDIPVDVSSPVRVRKGYNVSAKPAIIFPDENDEIVIHLNHLQRIEIRLTEDTGGDFGADVSGLRGYLLSGNSLNPLPAGSTYDTEKGIYYWQPGPGFYGNYHLLFITRDAAGQPIKKIVNITIH